MIIIFSDDTTDGDQSERSRLGLGSPRVSGSGQVDTETEETEAIKEETKPLVRDSGANTVKSGERIRDESAESGLVSCVTVPG